MLIFELKNIQQFTAVLQIWFDIEDSSLKSYIIADLNKGHILSIERMRMNIEKV